MKSPLIIGFLVMMILTGCHPNRAPSKLSNLEKEEIHNSIQSELNVLIQAVTNKDIDVYMDRMPEDFIIYDEEGKMITRDEQRAYALRDWSIIERTLNNEMKIDSIDFVTTDSIYVFTWQKWERLMYQRDGITIDTVITTQSHKELWKNKNNEWIGYDVEELGGNIFINGQAYNGK